MNYIDLIIILVLIWYLIDGFRRGFLNIFLEIVEFLLSIFIALRFYQVLGQKLSTIFVIPNFLQNIIAFIILWIVSEIFFSWLFSFVSSFIPSFLKKTFLNRISGVLISFVKGLFIVAILLTLVFALPALSNFKNDISSSFLGNKIVLQSTKLTALFQKTFGGIAEQTLLYLTPKPAEKEISLNFKPVEYNVDERSEQKMFELVNVERQKVGLKPLMFSTDLQKIARSHALDMWQRGYFGHISPDGADPAQRVLQAGIQFQVVGENLALAPNVNLAHLGLMQSPSHKENILDKDFGKIGVGVIDGGIYGKMFVQNFTD